MSATTILVRECRKAIAAGGYLSAVQTECLLIHLEALDAERAPVVDSVRVPRPHLEAYAAIVGELAAELRADTYADATGVRGALVRRAEVAAHALASEGS